MIFIFIKILVYDSEMGEDFVNRFFWGELNVLLLVFLLLLLNVASADTWKRGLYAFILRAFYGHWFSCH